MPWLISSFGPPHFPRELHFYPQLFSYPSPPLTAAAATFAWAQRNKHAINPTPLPLPSVGTWISTSPSFYPQVSIFLFLSVTSFQQRSQLTAFWTRGVKKNNENTDRAASLHVQQYFLYFKEKQEEVRLCEQVCVHLWKRKGEIEGWEIKNKEKEREKNLLGVEGGYHPSLSLFLSASRRNVKVIESECVLCVCDCV